MTANNAMHQSRHQRVTSMSTPLCGQVMAALDKSSGVRQPYVCQASVAPVHWGEDKSPHGSSILHHCRHADRPTDQRDYRADRSSHP
jgi:hypothetical protein